MKANRFLGADFCYRSPQIAHGSCMQFQILLAVALGGALGSLARYFVASAVQSGSSARISPGAYLSSTFQVDS